MAVTPTEDAEITRLLHAASGGDGDAFDRLMPLVYDHLRAIARNQRRDDGAFTINTTAMVHEAYIKLVDQKRATYQNRSQFFAIAATALRRIIVDHARSRLAQKRGGGWARVPLEMLGDGSVLTDDRAEHFVALDDALDRLRELDPRQCDVVTYRFFGGLTIEETADAVGISPATVKREWTMAKAWLHRELATP